MEHSIIGVNLQDRIPNTTLRSKSGITDVLKRVPR